MEKSSSKPVLNKSVAVFGDALIKGLQQYREKIQAARKECKSPYEYIALSATDESCEDIINYIAQMKVEMRELRVPDDDPEEKKNVIPTPETK